MSNEKIIQFLEKAIYKHLKEIQKINNWVNELGELGPQILEGHIKHKDHLINRIKEYKQQIKELENELYIC